MVIAGGAPTALSTAGGLVTLVFGLAGVAALTVAYFRTSYVAATIKTLTDSNAALNERLDLMKEDLEQCRIEVVAVTQERDNLKTYVTGTEAIKDLTRVLTDQHVETMRALTELTRTTVARRRPQHEGDRP